MENNFSLLLSFVQTTTSTQRPKAKNCKEIIDGKLQVQWEIIKDSVYIELYGRISEDDYMAFGLSGANGRAQMLNADVVVAFYDRSRLKFRVEDYYITHLSQCDGKQGVCPDERIGGKNDAVLCEFIAYKLLLISVKFKYSF